MRIIINVLAIFCIAILLWSCGLINKNGLTRIQKDQLDVNTAIREYLNVIGRSPRNKDDLTRFYAVRKDSITYYNRVLEIIAEDKLNVDFSDTLFSYEYRGINYKLPYVMKDVCYCGHSFCAELDGVRELTEQLKSSWLSSNVDSLKTQGLYFDNTSKVWDVTFIRKDDRFVLAEKQYNTIIKSIYSGFANTLGELDKFPCIDSISLILMVPSYHQSPPPPPPSVDTSSIHITVIGFRYEGK
jgi:hypothetical protein